MLVKIGIALSSMVTYHLGMTTLEASLCPLISLIEDLSVQDFCIDYRSLATSTGGAIGWNPLLIVEPR